MARRPGWTPRRVKRLRGHRTLEQFGELLNVPKNTVWRWEHGYATPNSERARRLSGIAIRERFREDWKLLGSVVRLDDIEKGSREIAEQVQHAIGRSSRSVERKRR